MSNWNWSTHTDILIFDDSQLITSRLRWTEQEPGTVKGIWQVTLFEPPLSASNWKNPPGLLQSGELPIYYEQTTNVSRDAPGGATATATLGVATGLPETDPPERSPSAVRRNAPVETTVSVSPDLASNVPATEPLEVLVSVEEAKDGYTKFIETGIYEIGFEPPPFPKLKLNGDETSRQTVYIRVVAVDSQGNIVGMPSNPIRLAIQLTKIAAVTEEEQEAKKHAQQIKAVKVASFRFTPLKQAASDAHQRFIVTQDMYMFEAGEKIKMTPSEDEWYDKVVDAIEDVGSFFVDAVNRVSAAWDDIKAAAVNIVASNLPIDCDDDCRKLLNGALDYGLTCVGIPPSIPDFDQLCEIGKGHIVGVLADEANELAAPGYVPREVVEEAVDKFLEEAKKTANHGAGGSGWLRPDLDYQYKETQLTLDMINTGTERSPAFHQKIKHELFVERSILIPSLDPGERVTIPMLMEQDIKRSLIPKYKKKTGRNVTMDWQDEVTQTWWDEYYYEELNLEFGNQVLARFVPGQGAATLSAYIVDE